MGLPKGLSTLAQMGAYERSLAIELLQKWNNSGWVDDKELDYPNDERPFGVYLVDNGGYLIVLYGEWIELREPQIIHSATSEIVRSISNPFGDADYEVTWEIWNGFYFDEWYKGVTYGDILDALWYARDGLDKDFASKLPLEKASASDNGFDKLFEVLQDYFDNEDDMDDFLANITTHAENKFKDF